MMRLIEHRDKRLQMKRSFQIAIVMLTFLCINIFVFAHDEIENFADDITVSEVVCTLANGEDGICFQVDSTAIPAFEIGPFCPETLDDVGGIWDWDGESSGLYSLDREFFEMVAEQGYVFYDDEGNISIVTNVGGGAPGGNGGGGNNTGGSSCLAQTADETITTTALIPTEPVMADALTDLGTVAKVGIGIDGVPIFADAPSVLDTGNLPALDVCGGHVDPGGWYHWHATASDIDSSLDHEGVDDVNCGLEQSASALFGYAFDGYAIYGSAEPDGSLAEDLDECNGHFGPTLDNVDGEYHYHATLDFPNLPTCLMGVVAMNNFTTTATSGIGAGNQNGGGPGGQGQNRPDFMAAAEQLGITEQDLQDALGQPPNFEAAAEELGISIEDLQDALGMTGG